MNSEDIDEDGLHWRSEYVSETNPYLRDSDENGLDDGEEDIDRDTLSNAQEQGMGTRLDRIDSDGDGIPDASDQNPTAPDGGVENLDVDWNGVFVVMRTSWDQYTRAGYTVDDSEGKRHNFKTKKFSDSYELFEEKTEPHGVYGEVDTTRDYLLERSDTGTCLTPLGRTRVLPNYRYEVEYSEKYEYTVRGELAETISIDPPEHVMHPFTHRDYYLTESSGSFESLTDPWVVPGTHEVEFSFETEHPDYDEYSYENTFPRLRNAFANLLISNDDEWEVSDEEASVEIEIPNPDGTFRKRKIELSEPYTASDFLGEVRGHRPALYIGEASSIDVLDTAWSSLSTPWDETWNDGKASSVIKSMSSFSLEVSDPNGRTLMWEEVFVPGDDPRTATDESLDDAVKILRTWKATTALSPIFQVGDHGAINGLSKFGSWEVRVLLLPVEVVQPKLDENLEAVKDGNGNDELVDPGQLRFCRWRDAFPKDSWQTGSHQFDTDFIEKDRDRVVIRIPGEAFDDAKQILSVFVRTEDQTGAVVDAETEVEFTRNEDDDFEFALALMTSEFDDQYDPAMPSGLTDENKNDRTHYGKLGGKLVLRIPDLGDAKIEKSLMKPKATVETKVYLMANSQGNIANMTRIVQKDFQTTEEIFAQLGINLIIHAEFFDGMTKAENSELAARLYDGDKIGFKHGYQDLNDILEVTNSPRKPTMPTVFYLDGYLYNFTGNSVLRGIAIHRDDNLLPHGYAAVSALDGKPNTLAHELGHLLGLAIGPTNEWVGMLAHYHYGATHLLMREFADYEDSPVKTSLRFDIRDEKWLFDFTPDQPRRETARSFIRLH